MLRQLALLLACAGLAGCTDASPLRLWVADDMVHLTERTPPSKRNEVWDAEVRTARLFSAANETVSFQLVLDASGRRRAGRVKLTVGPLSGPRGREIGPDNIRLFRMLPVAVNRYPAWYLRLADGPVRPSRFYDALVPIEPSQSSRPLDKARDKPLEMGPGERLAVWVDVAVPRDALPGEYLGPVTVRVGRTKVRARVSLKVYDFVLPDTRPVACIGAFSHETIFRQLAGRKDGRPGSESAEAKGKGGYVPIRLDTSRSEVRAALVVIRRLMRLAHDHRVDLFDKTIHPLIKRDMSGAVVLRWDDYDNIVKPYLDGTAFDDRIGAAAWPAPLWVGNGSGWPKPANYGGADTDAYRKTAAAVLAQTIKHFNDLGMSERLFVWLRTDSVGPKAHDRHIALASLVRSVGPELPILTGLSPTPAPKAFGALADMYAPAADKIKFTEAKQLAAKKHLLAGLWLRPGRPPYLGSCGLLGSPADVRALAWLAMKYDCPGIFIPEVLNWAGKSGQAGQGSENQLFYPPREVGPPETVLPSVRLKRLRRGLQDAAYLWLLRQRRREAIARTMIDTMVHYAGLDAAGDHHLDPRLNGWVAEGSVWVAARRLLAEEVLSAVHPQDDSKITLLAKQIAWKQLQQRACRVRVERLRSRVDMIAGLRRAQSSRGRFRAVIRAELYNERTHPVEVELRIAGLPPGWQTARRSLRRSLAGGERTVFELIAEGHSPPTGPNAKISIPLTMTTDLHQTDEMVAQVPLLMAGFVEDALTIDGDLSDWPLRPGNTAADFIALGRRGRGGKGLARRQTAVFAVHDESNLYLAFRCDEPNLEKARARPSNIIHYDQFLARGEDLVEIIVDPTRSAREAKGLYHLVVKCNGVVVAERGVGTEPGMARPWPVRARVAVARGEKVWFVEMAIPLKAFGPRSASLVSAKRAVAGPTWGINFTRFATAEAEASSWTGAVRYFYSPENLGTMYLMPKERQHATE